VAGWADVVSAVFPNTILRTAVQDALRGRLSSIQIAVVAGGPRLGDLESGVVADFTSTTFSVVSGGLICVIGSVVLAAGRSQFRRQRAPDQQVSPLS
jgi:hypothetical protein